MEEFKLKPFLRCENEEMNEYARAFEEFAMNLEASNIKRMIVAIDNVSAVIADDLNSLLDDGDSQTLRVLSDDKESKIFDRYMTLVQKVESFAAVTKHADLLRPGIAEYIDPNKKRAASINKDGNAFEELAEKARLKRERRLNGEA